MQGGESPPSSSIPWVDMFCNGTAIIDNDIIHDFFWSDTLEWRAVTSWYRFFDSPATHGHLLQSIWSTHAHRITSTMITLISWSNTRYGINHPSIRSILSKMRSDSRLLKIADCPRNTNLSIALLRRIIPCPLRVTRNKKGRGRRRKNKKKRKKKKGRDKKSG